MCTQSNYIRYKHIHTYICAETSLPVYIRLIVVRMLCHLPGLSNTSFGMWSYICTYVTRGFGLFSLGQKVFLIHSPTYTHKCTYVHICIYIYTGCHLHSIILVLSFRNIALMLLTIEFTASSYNLQGIMQVYGPTSPCVIYIYRYVYEYRPIDT